MKLPSNIICIDIETTDLSSEFGSVIQIGAVLLNQDFEEIDSFETYIRPLTSHRNSKAMEVNNISEDVLNHAPTLQEALEMFEVFALQGKSRTDKFILAAWGNYFDIPFLKAQYEKIFRTWPFGYKSFDLKTIAVWEFAKRNIEFPGGVKHGLEFLNLSFEGCQHDALADIKNTIRIFKKLLQQEKRETGWGAE